MGNCSIAISSMKVKDWKELERPILQAATQDFVLFYSGHSGEIMHRMYYEAYFTPTNLS